MPTLIACLSTGKGTWVEVIKLIQVQPWNNIYLITNQFGKENFKPQANTHLLVLDYEKDLSQLVREIKSQLKVTDFEVALNLISGTGKEHQALLEAILELGLNFRLVTIVNNQLKVLGIEQP